MKKLLRLFIRFLPDAIVEELNAASLDELDKRDLIIWADDAQNL
ncbi:hypothetical protein [Atlanticothrix silvestris]|nr:hypothetical protein [Atlanticothrix silvestris]